MLKMCVLSHLHGLIDEETEFQVLDRTSFRPFLGRSMSEKVPDARTLWLFKERLGAEGVRALCERFHQALSEQGLISKTCQIIDATVVKAPVPDFFDEHPNNI